MLDGRKLWTWLILVRLEGEQVELCYEYLYLVLCWCCAHQVFWMCLWCRCRLHDVLPSRVYRRVWDINSKYEWYCLGIKEESSSQAKQQGNQDRGTLLVQFMILLYCCV